MPDLSGMPDLSFLSGLPLKREANTFNLECCPFNVSNMISMFLQITIYWDNKHAILSPNF